MNATLKPIPASHFGINVLFNYTFNVLYNYSMQKSRLYALDGLRGFAALSVFFSHSGFDPRSITQIPAIFWVYKTLSVGPNSVQILFVLSGFLMAYLYAEITSIRQFIMKRYARIFPVFAVITLFIWLIGSGNIVTLWYQQLAILLGLALIIYLGWNGLRKFDNKKKFGTILFFVFAVFQLAVLLINLIITPKITVAHTLVVPDRVKSLIDLISTVTLTTPFVKGILQLSNVFWSLAPEVYFYLLYPFIVIPLVRISRRCGFVVSALIVIAVTKILLDLDTAISSILSFHAMNIARANGFIAGVVVGTLYQSRGKIWRSLETIFSNPIAGIVVFLGFIAIQAGDWTIRDGQAIWFMNLYYLLSSWVIALTVICAIIPGTIINKIFSIRALTFLGMISYSLYLVHNRVIPMAEQIMAPYMHFFSAGIGGVVQLAVMLSMTIGVSYLLYRLVEYLYFQSKSHKTHTAAATVKEAKRPLFTGWPAYIFGGLAVVAVILWLYSGGFVPSLYASHHRINGTLIPKEVSLLHNPLRVPITSSHNNLSVVILNLRYAKNADRTRKLAKNPAVLDFRLYEEGNSKPIFTSTRHGYEVEGEPHYPFGFPTIADSAGKKYIVELKQQYGSAEDQVIADISPASLVTLYSNSRKEILFHPHLMLWNRTLFALSHPDGLFAVTSVVFLTTLYGLSSRKNKLSPKLGP